KTELVVVDGCVDPRLDQGRSCLTKLTLIVEWVDPEARKVRPREPSHLQAHERDVVNECEVARDELRKIWKPSECLLMDHDSDFNPLPQPLQIEYTPDRFIERAIRLNDIVMDV